MELETGIKLYAAGEIATKINMHHGIQLAPPYIDGGAGNLRFSPQ